MPEGGLTPDMIVQLKSEGKIVKIENFKLGSNAEEDNVPYAICTPKYWSRDGLKGHYRWPKESVPMLLTNGNAGAYEYDGWGNSQYFKNWVANKNNDTQWYKYPNPSITIAPTGISEDIDDDDMFDLQDPELNIKINNNITMLLASLSTIVEYTTLSSGAITVSCNPDNVVDVELAEGDKRITITPKGVGTTTVTLTQAAAGDYYGVIKSFTVTVIEKYDTDLSVNPKDIEVEKDKVVYVNYSTPSDGELDFSWNPDNYASAKVVNNQIEITGLKEGETTLTIKQKATDSYYPAEQTITVKVVDYTKDILQKNTATDLTHYLSMGNIPATIFQNLENKITITITGTDPYHCSANIMTTVEYTGWTGDFTILNTTVQEGESETKIIDSQSNQTENDNSGNTFTHEYLIQRIKENGLKINGQNITLTITID